VTGDDLIAAGYAPGPDFSRMLEVAEDAQLEARIQSKEEGWNWCDRRSARREIDDNIYRAVPKHQLSS
jgi:hypothetical protein